MIFRLIPFCLLIGFICPVSIAQAPFQLYFGLLHSHTSFSDGSGTPAEAYQAAREAGLDFFALTEHNHNQAAGDDGTFLTPSSYQDLQIAAGQATQNGDFIALFGQEVSSISKGNHVNVFNANSICDVANGDFKTFYEQWLPAHPEVPIVQFNHPDVSRDQNPNTQPSRRNNDYGIDDYNQDFPALVNAAGERVGLIELIIGPAFSEATDKPHHNGAHEADYLFYLNQGFRLAPSVGQDNHKRTWGLATHARLGLWATALSKLAIYDALEARRTYASEDDTVQVKFTVNNAWMGSELAVDRGQAVAITAAVTDADEPDAAYTLMLFYDAAVGDDEARIIDVATVIGDSETEFLHSPEPGGYYFLKVKQRSDAETDADDVWTSPVWIATSSTPNDGDEEHRDSTEIDWRDAGDFIGLERIVTGRIIGSFNSGRVLFLNFDANFRDHLSLVVLGQHFTALGGPEALAERLDGKQVRIRGTISTFRGRLQLLIENEAQILSVGD